MLTKELCVMTRKKISLLYAKRYRKAKRKKDKSEILDEFIRVTGYNQNYASWLLRYAGKRVYIRQTRREKEIDISGGSRNKDKEKAKEDI